MISKLNFGILLTVTTLLAATSATTFAADARQNKINKYTKQLKQLPNRAAPAAKISALVKKLANLQPDKTGQYYSLGLRKLALPGASGEAFAKQLSDDLQKIVKKSDLSPSDMAKMVRRINKTQRLFTPLSPEPTPEPVSPSANLFSHACLSIV